MSSLGNYLRELRQAKSMSLDDIARSTRVGRRHLEALESDDFAELPAPVFVKGFIRAYCEFLDASPEEALGRYRETTGEAAKPERPAGGALVARPRRVGPLTISIVLFLALGVSLFALRAGLRSPPRPAPAVTAPTQAESGSVPKTAPAPSKAAPATAPAPAAAPPAAAPPAVSAPASAEAKPSGQRLVVRAVEATWIRVQVDDGQVAEELLQVGAVREWSAARRFVLTVGNAGGIELDLNGQRVPPLGPSGTVIQRLVLPQETPGAGS